MLVVILPFCLLQGVLISYYASSLAAHDSDGDHGGSLGRSEGNKRQLHLSHHQGKQNYSDAQVKALSASPPATTEPNPCWDDACTGHLRTGSLETYKMCERLAYLKTLVPSQDIPRRCKFRDGRGVDSVALVSVPGSGNTWVRGLLEKVTGICTGSIYCDAPLRVSGFIGEYIHDGSVLVVKTHTSDHQWKGKQLEKRNQEDGLYSSAILLIRNPFDTFVSERHRSILLNITDTQLLQKQHMHGVGNVGVDDASHVHGASSEAFGMSETAMPGGQTYRIA